MQACRCAENEVDVAIKSFLREFTKRMVFTRGGCRCDEALVSEGQKLVAIDAFAAALFMAGLHRVVHPVAFFVGWSGASAAFEHMARTPCKPGGSVARPSALLSDLGKKGEQAFCNKIHALLPPRKMHEKCVSTLTDAIQLTDNVLSHEAAAYPDKLPTIHPWRIEHKGVPGPGGSQAAGAMRANRLADLMAEWTKNGYHDHVAANMKYGENSASRA